MSLHSATPSLSHYAERGKETSKDNWLPENLFRSIQVKG